MRGPSKLEFSIGPDFASGLCSVSLGVFLSYSVIFLVISAVAEAFAALCFAALLRMSSMTNVLSGFYYYLAGRDQ